MVRVYIVECTEVYCTIHKIECIVQYVHIDTVEIYKDIQITVMFD